MLRIHLILMRIRILDPQWKKMDPDRDLGHFLKFTEFFFTKQNYQIYCLFFAYLLKLYEPLTKSGNFYNLFFSIVQIWVLRVKNLFFSIWLKFCPLVPDSWIRHFCGSGFRKPNTCGSNGSGS